MSLLRLKTSLYILASGFLLGFCMAIFFVPVKACPESSKPLPTAAKQLSKQLVTVEKEYRGRITVLEKQNNQIQSDLTITQSLLSRVKCEAAQREKKVQSMIAADKAKPKTASYDNYVIPLFDSGCDSLRNEVTNYIKENHRKDSLYEIQLASMDSVVSVKDSIILFNEKRYNSFYQIYDQAIGAQLILQEENRLLKKKEKRRKRGSRLIGAGMLVITGSILHFIHH